MDEWEWLNPSPSFFLATVTAATSSEPLPDGVCESHLSKVIICVFIWPAAELAAPQSRRETGSTTCRRVTVPIDRSSYSKKAVYLVTLGGSLRPGSRCILGKLDGTGSSGGVPVLRMSDGGLFYSYDKRQLLLGELPAAGAGLRDDLIRFLGSKVKVREMCWYVIYR